MDIFFKVRIEGRMATVNVPSDGEPSASVGQDDQGASAVFQHLECGGVLIDFDWPFGVGQVPTLAVGTINEPSQP